MDYNVRLVNFLNSNVKTLSGFPRSARLRNDVAGAFDVLDYKLKKMRLDIDFQNLYCDQVPFLRESIFIWICFDSPNVVNFILRDELSTIYTIGRFLPQLYEEKLR